MATPFLNRTADLHRLATHWASHRPELLVVTGRRRVGKSRLLEEFFRDKPSIHIVGTVAKAPIQLADASREIFRVTRDPVVEHQDFTSWDSLLVYITCVHRRVCAGSARRLRHRRICPLLRRQPGIAFRIATLVGS